MVMRMMLSSNYCDDGDEDDDSDHGDDGQQFMHLSGVKSFFWRKMPP